MNFITRFFRWLNIESSYGKIIQDYGIISELPLGAGCQKISILLCQRKDKLQIVIKTVDASPLSTRTWYNPLPASCASRMKEIMEEIETKNTKTEQPTT